MKKIIFLSIVFSIISLVFFSSCKKKVIEPIEIKTEVNNPSLSIEMIDGSHALVIAECESTGNMEGVEVSLRGAITEKMILKEITVGHWKDTLEVENNGVNGYVHGFFKPVYGGTTHIDEGVNSVTSDDPYLEWIVKTEIELGEAINVPTETGGTSTIEISNVEENKLVSVVATKISDNTLLGEYAISVDPSDKDFEVFVDFTDYPIFSTEINLRVSVDDLVKNYQYTTLEEESCGLSLEGSYVEVDDEVNITISGNDRPSSLTFKAYNGSTLLNTYGGTMTENEENKTFSFPVEIEQGITVSYVVTSEQHPLCILDGFSYVTPINPNPITTISVSGASPGSLKPSGGIIFGSYTNENLPNGESSILMVQTPSEGILLVDPQDGELKQSIKINLSGEMGSFTYEFVSDRDENNAVFLYDCEYFESQPANTTITTLTQTYGLYGSVDIVQIDSLQANTTQFMSADLSTNYTGTKSKNITLKIKNTLTGHNPWEYLSLLVINGTNVPVSNISDWGNTDSEGFYTFTINTINDINISNIDYVTVGYRSKPFVIGSGDSFDIKLSLVVDFIDRSVGSTFITETVTKNITIE